MDNGTQEFVTLSLDAYEDVINHVCAAKHMAMIAWDRADRLMLDSQDAWSKEHGVLAIAKEIETLYCLDILRCHPSYLGSK